MAHLPPTTTYQALPYTRTNSTVPLFFLSFSISCPRFFTSRHSTNQILSSPIHLRRPSPPNSNSWSRRCRATSPSPGPPSPPEPDPPVEEGPIRSTGLAATFSRFQDSVQIFFAVLFWMSLFFWASSWDQSNNGRPNKGSRFRR